MIKRTLLYTLALVYGPYHRQEDANHLIKLYPDPTGKYKLPKEQP